MGGFSPQAVHTGHLCQHCQGRLQGAADGKRGDLGGVGASERQAPRGGSSVLYCMGCTLYCTVLYCTVLYCTVLQFLWCCTVHGDKNLFTTKQSTVVVLTLPNIKGENVLRKVS